MTKYLNPWGFQGNSNPEIAQNTFYLRKVIKLSEIFMYFNIYFECHLEWCVEERKSKEGTLIYINTILNYLQISQGFLPVPLTILRYWMQPFFNSWGRHLPGHMQRYPPTHLYLYVYPCPPYLPLCISRVKKGGSTTDVPLRVPQRLSTVGD